jgi:hypothetical protein
VNIVSVEFNAPIPAVTTVIGMIRRPPSAMMLFAPKDEMLNEPAFAPEMA